MIGFIMAIEKASEFNWHNISIETNSMYVVNLYTNGTNKIPWRLHNCWSKVVINAKRVNMAVAHIFREGNNIADRLASQASYSQQHRWWMGIPYHLATVAYRDHLDLPFY